MSRPVVDVAVGILTRPDGRFLLADRPHGKPYAHYWEFPGGKLEPGESVTQALSRELREELGIDVGFVRPWVVREFEYPHAYVRLHFCRVQSWNGNLHAHEGQSFRFCTLDDLPSPLLPATVPVLRWLALPSIYAITNASELGTGELLRRIDRQLALGLRLVQFREPVLAPKIAEQLFLETLRQVRAAGGRLLVSSRHPREWAQHADGIHLTARDLLASDGRPEVTWVGASTHSSTELERAAELGIDFAVYGPVAPTVSHPGVPGCGWSSFSRVATAAKLPLYAIGGLAPRDVDPAQDAGAHGIALQRAIWADA